MEKITCTKERLVLALILLFSVVFAISTLLNLGMSYHISRLLIITMFFVLYLLSNKTENFFLGLFLLAIALSEAAYFIHFFYKNVMLFYIGSIANTIAYICLFNHVIVDVKFSVLFKKHILHLIISIAIGVYGFVILNDMLSYHDNTFKDFLYVMDLSYNLFIVLVFIFSFLNYVYKGNRKALMLFIACLCIVVSEFLWVFSLFSSERTLFNITIMLLKLTGFYCIYNYLMFKSEKPNLNEINA
jgi:hypothetical protein